MKRSLRITIGILFPAAILTAAFCTMSARMHLICVFHELTGLYCPGCGSGRAVNALMNGKIAEAFAWNPLVFFLGFPSLVILVREYLRLILPKLRWKPVTIPQPIAVAACGILIVFWILRNLPLFGFLAPGGLISLM